MVLARNSVPRSALARDRERVEAMLLKRRSPGSASGRPSAALRSSSARSLRVIAALTGTLCSVKCLHGSNLYDADDALAQPQ
jgi:hypothetical protein